MTQGPAFGISPFFERGRWGTLVEKGAEGESLTREDQLLILMQAGLSSACCAVLVSMRTRP